MNIFEYHLSEIKKIILLEKDSLKLSNIDNFKGINLEIPPEIFNFDLSCNIAMVLGKKNNIDPKNLALKLKDIFLKKIVNFSEIEIAGPGFLNIKKYSNSNTERIICDYIAGMTDRYAINLYNQIK